VGYAWMFGLFNNERSRMAPAFSGLHTSYPSAGQCEQRQSVKNVRFNGRQIATLKLAHRFFGKRAHECCDRPCRCPYKTSLSRQHNPVLVRFRASDLAFSTAATPASGPLIQALPRSDDNVSWQFPVGHGAGGNLCPATAAKVSLAFSNQNEWSIATALLNCGCTDGSTGDREIYLTGVFPDRLWMLVFGKQPMRECRTQRSPGCNK